MALAIALLALIVVGIAVAVATTAQRPQGSWPATIEPSRPIAGQLGGGASGTDAARPVPGFLTIGDTDLRWSPSPAAKLLRGHRDVALPWARIMGADIQQHALTVKLPDGDVAFRLRGAEGLAEALALRIRP